MSTIKTLGQSRVRLSFNPSSDEVVNTIKTRSAELIDLIQSAKNTVVSETYDTQTPAELQQDKGEFLRLIALAQTAIEEGCMWACKAVTINK